MRERFNAWIRQEITAPRWVGVIWFLRDAFLVLGAVVVIILWWQAATRDEEADRNARIQSCASVYAATTTAWDAVVLSLDEQGEAIFAELIADSASGADPDPQMVDEYRRIALDAAAAAEKVDELARRRIGLGIYSAASVVEGNDFRCPPIDEDLMVTPVYPDGYEP